MPGMLRARFFFAPLLLSLLMPGCDEATAEPVEDAARGQTAGKLDHLSGSCGSVDACGGKSNGECWCDESCWSYGDCCSDAAEICNVDECNLTEQTGCEPGEACAFEGVAVCQPASFMCQPQDAKALGQCFHVLGYAFDGNQCVKLQGCTCKGSECVFISDSMSECEAIYSQCTEGTCPDPADPNVKYHAFDSATCARISGARGRARGL